MAAIIAAYRSRTITMQVYTALTEQGIYCSLISTPQEAGVGCGLSVKFDEGNFGRVSGISRYPTFAGFFRVLHSNGRRIVTRV